MMMTKLDESTANLTKAQPPGAARRRERARATLWPTAEIYDKWCVFHAENPEVWELFKRYTFQIIERGYRNYSARAVIHRIRWHTSVETRGSDFKINNNWTPHYSRLFREAYPEHSGFFRTRELRDEGPWQKGAA